MNHVSRLAGVVLGCLFLLSGCGGGGGGGDSGSTPTNPTNPTTPPPSAVVSGRLWHSDSDVADSQGTFVSDLVAGATARVSSNKWAVPSVDGSRLSTRAYTSNGSVGDETRITVTRTTDGQTLSDQTVDGYLGDVRPSPQNGSQLLAPWGESINGPRAMVVYDVEQRKLLYATPASDTPDALSWMPDGSLLRARASGAISKVVIGSPEQAVATVAWPESRRLQAIYVSPDGTKVLAQLAALRASGTVSGVDLWMMNIDGSNLKRYTKNDLITSALWSPDSKFVAITKDTGVNCTEFTCQGSCTVWYADATASDVVAVEASGDAKPLPVKRLNGSAKNLSCPVMAWTP